MTDHSKLSPIEQGFIAGIHRGSALMVIAKTPWIKLDDPPLFVRGDLVRIIEAEVASNAGNFRNGWLLPLKIAYYTPQFGRAYMCVDAEGRREVVEENCLERLEATV